MQTGTGPAGIKPDSIDGSMLDVPDLPLKLVDKGTANPDDQLVQDKPGTDATDYSIGKKDQCDFICPNDVKLLGFDGSGNTIVKDQKTSEEYLLKRDGQTSQWSRVS